ncbi:transposase [Caulobacter sp.]|uniref:IS66-like element accessory protein TnpA n=1 Tax=Caulobacter sp. TaxID=78 RepID=UPI001B00BD28|nr:transposase [Caulobacter sp.]MBO9545780.1 transposase [Caulobacter sp.]
MSHSTLIMGPERRRRWSAEAKRAVLEAAFAPGAIVVEVAREYEISTSLIYKWRQEAIGMSAAPAFAPALLVEEGRRPQVCAEQGSIVVELAGGTRVSISAEAPASLVTATLRALR